MQGDADPPVGSRLLSFTLPGVLMPKPAQNRYYTTGNAQCWLYSTHAPALSCTLSLLTVWSKVDCTYHRHVPLVRVALPLAMCFKAQLSSSLGMAENVF